MKKKKIATVQALLNLSFSQTHFSHLTLLSLDFTACLYMEQDSQQSK